VAAVAEPDPFGAAATDDDFAPFQSSPSIVLPQLQPPPQFAFDTASSTVEVLLTKGPGGFGFGFDKPTDGSTHFAVTQVVPEGAAAQTGRQVDRRVPSFFLCVLLLSSLNVNQRDK
jgi:hypothetical protein